MRIEIWIVMAVVVVELAIVVPLAYGVEWKELPNVTKVIDKSVPQEGRLVAVTGPMKCHKEKGGGFSCESGDWIPVGNASNTLSPYWSGYQHGVNDARWVGNGTHYYYMQQTGGFAGHTEKFNDGYIAGWCKVQGKDASSDDDAYTFHCDTDVRGP